MHFDRRIGLPVFVLGCCVVAVVSLRARAGGDLRVMRGKRSGRRARPHGVLEVYGRSAHDSGPPILTPAERDDVVAFLQALSAEPRVTRALTYGRLRRAVLHRAKVPAAAARQGVILDVRIFGSSSASYTRQ